jgi:multiple antibiotic resistance protein
MRCGCATRRDDDSHKEKPMNDIPDAPHLLGLYTVFILLFVTLGPIKVLGPFMQLTHDADEARIKQIAVRAFVLGSIAAVVGGCVGKLLVLNWQISNAALTLAGGIIFLLVGLSVVLQQYQPAPAAPIPLPQAPMAAALRVAFPIVATPYGIAAVIALLVNSPDLSRTGAVIAILIAVMMLNLLAMLYARRIMAGATILALQIFGAVLGVLQVALAVQFTLRGLYDLGVLKPG